VIRGYILDTAGVYRRVLGNSWLHSSALRVRSIRLAPDWPYLPRGSCEPSLIR
jgi:hypothetical protein